MQELWKHFPPGLDLTDPRQLGSVVELADAVLTRQSEPDELAVIERSLSTHPNTPLMAQVAMKLARSKALVSALGRPLHLSVVFAVYKEHNRILTRAEHPHGEDFLREKIRQLRWLFAGIDNVSWELIVVDDGCPEESGRIAQRILDGIEFGEGEAARVLFLREAIEADVEVVRPLRSTDESRKGGSILLGMAEAAATSHDGHVVLFTDADLSTHLGQCGSLVDPILRGEADAAIGSRREPTSISIKQGTRNLRGKLFIYLWKRLFPPLCGIVDTQCGFKAFDAELVREITVSSLEKQFAFDIELLLKTELRSSGRIRKVPIAWIDSEAASTTTDLQPYLPMLHRMVDIYRHYLPSDGASDAFAEFIEELDDDSWGRLVDAVPGAIAEREPHTFGDWSGVDVRELRSAAGVG